MKRDNLEAQATSDRKLEHIKLTDAAQTAQILADKRFYYEPLFSGNREVHDLSLNFAGHQLELPIWVSSMTGGTGVAAKINENLARACADFGIGMGLGSCRKLLSKEGRSQYFSDFDISKYTGKSPFYANLGVAQLEELIEDGELYRAKEVVELLGANGLIIHINPAQEWFQPEGDIIKRSPLEIITICLEEFDFPIIVKEVGQGMGPKSLAALMQLELAAIEFAAFGGTNFSKLEFIRNSNDLSIHEPLCHVGHTALEMVNMSNQIIDQLGEQVRCKNFIISGGIKSYIDGFYLCSLSKGNAIFGMASEFLKTAMVDYESVSRQITQIKAGLAFANSYLSVRSEN
ncbi:putative isopentenyl-diphosphate delta-isomerase, type 2 [Bacteriovorax sp. BAL6_X]|uniref:type 2 isopentenyl-diphosphate Delta-isomerase n=1 Tax=Bacteriovorax sp. BAL6_X TaxID=1201290 RepID=UPI0003856B70|nr:type 2 isopentenyl-diphosphate Delta-isomerase [Bacteriovorax sp. BAL6_X]EPZ51122.1 putative isopentenyl-diphosphate delta-isomerase, type 2 [Bacteriovorax sp. BAL6_X]